MNAPIVTAMTLAEGLTIKELEPQIVTFEYLDGTAPYIAKLKVTRTLDGVFVMCPACGCQTRQLWRQVTRIGLFCGDCRRRAEHKAELAKQRVKPTKTAP